MMHPLSLVDNSRLSSHTQSRYNPNPDPNLDPNPNPNLSPGLTPDHLETWLDGVASTVKSSPEGQRPWESEGQTRVGRDVYVAIIILRALSAVFAGTVSIIVGLTITARWNSTVSWDRMIPPLTFVSTTST